MTACIRLVLSGITVVNPGSHMRRVTWSDLRLGVRMTSHHRKACHRPTPGCYPEDETGSAKLLRAGESCEPHLRQRAPCLTCRTRSRPTPSKLASHPFVASRRVVSGASCATCRRSQVRSLSPRMSCSGHSALNPRGLNLDETVRNG